MVKEKKLKISAIICTYNRDPYLGKAIKSLLEQSLADDEYEIIIVDNASTDKTKEIVEKYRDKVKYIYEPNQGLSYARNAGYLNSNADIVTYLDDDALASSEWLSSALEAFEKDKNIAAVGGKIEPIWEAEKPKWLIKELYIHFSCQDKGPDPFYLKSHDYVWGGNAAYRKRILYDCGGFPVELGRIGKMQLVHEELPVSEFINKIGLKKYYMPSMLIRHHVMQHRINLRFLVNRFFWLGASTVYHEYLYNNMKKASILNKFFKFIPGYFFRKQKFILICLNFFRYAGVFYALTKNIGKHKKVAI